MTREEVKNLVFDSVKEQLGVTEVTEESRLAEDLGADSLDQVEMIMKAEEALNVEIPDEDVAELKTVGDFVEYLCTKVEVVD